MIERLQRRWLLGRSCPNRSCARRFQPQRVEPAVKGLAERLPEGIRGQNATAVQGDNLGWSDPKSKPPEVGRLS